jgi:predicted XRE-type DNA-binding protein
VTRHKPKLAIPTKFAPPEHVPQGNVFDDLGFPPKKAASLKLKASLHEKIMGRARRFSQAELATILSESQPRVSDLMRGKLAKFSLEMLVFYGERLGICAQEVRTVQRRMPARLQAARAR